MYCWGGVCVCVCASAIETHNALLTVMSVCVCVCDCLFVLLFVCVSVCVWLCAVNPIATLENYARTGMRRIFSLGEARRHDHSLSEPSFSRTMDLSSMSSRLLNDDALGETLGETESEIAADGGLLEMQVLESPTSTLAGDEDEDKDA
jgi:hypothetical protein